MDEVDPFGFERRVVLLDAWVDVRRRIAVLEAEAAALLGERWDVAEADVREAPVHRDAIRRSMVAEYSAAGRVSNGSVEYAFSDAVHARDLTAVVAAFAAGSITGGHVREIVRAAEMIRDGIAQGTLTGEVLQTYAEAVVVIAERETPARTRVCARQVAAALAEQTVAERHRAAMDERAVTVRPVGDGLAVLTAVLPEYLAVAVMDRLTQLARIVTKNRKPDGPDGPDRDDGEDFASRQVQRADLERALAIPVEMIPGDDDGSCGDGCLDEVDSDDSGTGGVPFDADYAFLGDAIFSLGDTFTTDPFGPMPSASADLTGSDGAVDDVRSMDQLRADLFTDLLLASDPTVHGDGLDRVAARIQVTVAATTLAGADDRLAELDTHGPLHPDIARDIASRNGGWTRLFLNPAGQITATDTYTPTEPMRRRLRARDEHCRFMGCLTPTHRCDIDHQHDHAHGGPTALNNLAHLCRTHHTLKHPNIPTPHRWTATQNPDGTLTWTSPLGHTHTDHPPASTSPEHRT